MTASTESRLSPRAINVDRLAPSSPPPISLDLIKQHLAIDGAENDELLNVYMYSAIRWAEGAMRRTIYERKHVWILERFPYGGYQDIRLPRGLARSVEKIDYIQGGLKKTLRGPSSGSPVAADFQEDLDSEDGGLLRPNQGHSWPSADADAIKPVEVHFVAGWTIAEVPEEIVQALLFAIADQFETRSSIDLTQVGTRVDARYALISPFVLRPVY